MNTPDDQDPSDQNAASPLPQSEGEDLEADVDQFLDEIDETLGEEADAFIRTYVQKGGQGWSAFLDPAFFVGAAAAGVAAAATWDSFKLVMTKVIQALRQTGSPAEVMLDEDGLLTRETERRLMYAWRIAKEVRTPSEPIHDMDEATAVHWLAFLPELHRAAGFVQLRPDHYRKIRAIAADTPEQLMPSQLVAKIVDEWLSRHPEF